MRPRALLSLAAVLALAPSTRLSAETLPYDHVHLAVPDVAKAVDWYAKYFGGTPVTGETPDRLMFGKTRLVFLVKADAQPSAGSAIDHIGFSVPDIEAKMKELEAGGVKVLNPVRDVPGLFKLAFIEDPWGVKIEVVQDPATLGFHHVHLRATNPEEALKWYVDMFGGERTKFKDRLDAVRYGDVWLLAQKADAVTPSEGHAIDHIGWRVTDLDNKATELKTKAVKFTTEPRPFNKLRIAYVEGPAGTRIELVQR